MVVDPSAFARAALPRLIEADPQLEVVGVARDIEEAFPQLESHDPDVVLMALASDAGSAIPGLERMLEHSPRPVVMLMAPGAAPADQLRALEAGAITEVAWEVLDDAARLMAFQSLLVSKLKALGSARGRPNEPAAAPKLAGVRRGRDEGSSQDATAERTVEVLREEAGNVEAHRPRSPLALSQSSGLIQPRRILSGAGQDPDRRAEVAVLGAGAGGVAALRRIVTQLPPNLNIALIALIRLPAELLPAYAEQLARDAAIRVAVALEGDPIRPGMLLLAPVGTNLGMVRTGRVPKALVRLVQPEPGASTVPSIDVTLRACAAIYGANTVGIVLSGLGRDGVAGLQAVKAKGGITATLDHRSAIVAATNQMCQDAGVVDEVLDPTGIVAMITRLGLRL
jgi:two-component system chemotaxis response regulator CheB